ncbi:hypothetical protein PFLUV_G00149070 [Perca fluviatilis]|uniref:Uncharacterized protein n=1 Tax=Perca fluviatilis TaxID=8168 RepID=A0A6A5F5V4_PERFL|nr:hypothetical protein PFLUV_G00149070 [Perca fluviatilis]
MCSLSTRLQVTTHYIRTNEENLIHYSLAPETPLATDLTDRVDPPISACLRVPLKPRGKTDRAINEKLSQVLSVEGDTSLYQCAVDYTTIDTLLLCLWILIPYCFDTEDVYKRRQVTHEVTRALSL